MCFHICFRYFSIFHVGMENLVVISSFPVGAFSPLNIYKFGWRKREMISSSASRFRFIKNKRRKDSNAKSRNVRSRLAYVGEIAYKTLPEKKSMAISMWYFNFVYFWVTIMYFNGCFFQFMVDCLPLLVNECVDET